MSPIRETPLPTVRTMMQINTTLSGIIVFETAALFVETIVERAASLHFGWWTTLFMFIFISILIFIVIVILFILSILIIESC